MAIDPRTPVIVGAAVHNDRSELADPVALMAQAAERALGDTDEPHVPAHALDWIRVPWGIWPYRDPARLVAELLGSSNARTTKTTVGGNQVYDLVIDTAVRLRDGIADVVLICGAENGRSRSAAAKQDGRFEYIAERPGSIPDETFGSPSPLTNAAEDAVGLNQPVNFYAMVESAIRHRRNEHPPDHLARIAGLWARGADVARQNPHAWITDPPEYADIATTSASNRPIAAPYSKLLSSNPVVNQGGALVLCTVEAAQRMAISSDRWTFVWSGASASDAQFMTDRWALDESPAIRLAGNRTLELAGIGHTDCRFIDLYSCFPSAVQVAQRELGIDESRQWTITGGLTFAAGPLNCYCLLPAVQAVSLLRDHPDDLAFLTGNGGYLSKHSFITLSGRPSGQGFLTDDVQPAIDQLPTRPDPTNTDSTTGPTTDSTTGTTTGPSGRQAIEAYTVTYGRAGAPQTAIVSILDGEARRFVATDTPDLIDHLLSDDRCGEPPPDSISH